MVHYNPPILFAAQRPSPLCPQCGSHRTEIIGVAEDQKTKFLRCVACGAHSRVPSQDALEVAPTS